MIFRKIKTVHCRLLEWVKRNKFVGTTFVFLLLAYLLCLPETLFDEPYATVIESDKGTLLGAKIAADGQWRLPAQDSVPEKFRICITQFEDRHFYRHPGFNPLSIAVAFKDNLAAGKVVRGGSTLTQQVIRLARKNHRTYFEKLIEIILSTRLELRHSKDEILGLYAAHAPFGGNVVGLEMASWRYFGVQSHQLSWAEAATLAVLPNAPSLIYPGKNQDRLRAKRDRLLFRLRNEKFIGDQTYRLALAEPLPEKPYDLPEIAPHLLQRVAKQHLGKRVRTTIDAPLQQRVNEIAAYYHSQYRQNDIHNLAVIVVDVKNRDIIAYVGNAPTDADHQKDVDIITAPRSSGSILKPLLFAGMLDQGELLPNSLVADVPTQIAGFSPENFDLTFDGAVPARRALARSLNVPSVLMLQDHGVSRFYNLLRKLRLKDVSRPPGDYGLSLILGGAESNLWDLCRTYAGMTGTLEYFCRNQGRYRADEFAELNFIHGHEQNFGKDMFRKNIFGAGSIWHTYAAMQEVNRPEGDEAWKFYDSSLPIAWKTGTSFGNRDAWAIGTSRDYVVGVWVGNATGEGRPELTGVGSAAPLLFDVFNLLPKSKNFPVPLNDLEEAEVCATSGFLAKNDCPKTKQMVPLSGVKSRLCPYHKLIHVDQSAAFQVNLGCAGADDIKTMSWFVLPPVMEWFYKSRHIEYRTLPPFREGCGGGNLPAMDFIYPRSNARVYLTRDFDGQIQPVILKVAHTQRESKLFWYVDNVFLGTTVTFHEMPVKPTAGSHFITVSDEAGNEIVRRIEIIRD